jgi:Flp pilus assembly pilin Flp
LAEYALILAFVSVIAVSVMLTLTGQVKTAFTTVDRQIAIAGNGGPASSAPPPPTFP